MSEFLISDQDARISRDRRDSFVVNNRVYKVYGCVGVVVMIKEYVDADSCDQAIEIVKIKHPELNNADWSAEQHPLFAPQN